VVCLTHMTGKKEWFVNMEEMVNGKIKFADDRSLMVEGSGRIVLRDTDSREVVIEEVLYVPGLKTNLLSLGQLLQKGFVMKMEDNSLSIFDQSKRLVIKANLSKNRTFRVVMKVVKHQCFSTIEKEVEWLWHLRLGHLNFRDLFQLIQRTMVKGLLVVNILETVCQECVQCKQTRGSFQSCLPHKTSERLEIMYSYVCGPIQMKTPGGSRYCVFH